MSQFSKSEDSSEATTRQPPDPAPPEPVEQNNTSNQEQHTAADKTLIQYIQNAIIYIKKERQQCNLKSIYAYLKQHYNDYGTVQTLCEKDLMKHLEAGVREGILSRKFGDKTNTASSSAQQTDAANSSKRVISTASPFKLPASLPSEATASADVDKALLNLILPVLIRAVVHLNDQKLNSTSEPTNEDERSADQALNENTSSLTRICTYLSEVYTFEMAGDSGEKNEGADGLFRRLKECVKYLLKKNEKIFIIKKGTQQNVEIERMQFTLFLF